MLRFLAFLVGIAFVAALAFAALAPREDQVMTMAHAQSSLQTPDFPQRGVLGRFDKTQLQRGFKVFKEVCSQCHSVKMLAFADLQGIGFSEAQVKAIARTWPVQVATVGQDTGEASERPALPTDKIPSPYANEVMARLSNNNALPPDLSLITKARAHGVDYVYSLLMGYVPAPESWKLPPGLHYNMYYPALNIAMPAPLVEDGQVEYTDGTKASVSQMSQDVAAFLQWTAEPKLEERHRIGFGVMIFLLILTGLSYLCYRQVWREDKD